MSYKGGDIGFIRIAGRRELQIPSYDGNGMWRTLGNSADDGERVVASWVRRARASLADDHLTRGSIMAV